MNRREILRYTAIATGAAISAPFASAFLTGCKREPTVEPYMPVFFSQDEYDFISRFADTIIPRTDTPGASDVGVPEMIDQTVGVVYGAEDREIMRAGLLGLIGKMNADQTGETTAADLDDDAMLAYLKELDATYKDPDTEWPPEVEGEVSPREAYFGLKGMVIANYFGSQEVVMNQLVYDPVPGEYIACGDLQELTGGKAWAL